MPNKLSNKEIILIIKEALAAMQVKDYSFFKIRAYENALVSLENLNEPIFNLWENGQLNNVPGIGGSIIGHLSDLFEKGQVEEFEKAKEGLPKGMFGLLGIRGIGAKRAFKLASAFNLHDKETAAEKLKIHAKAGQIRVLPGFGEKSESDILSTLEQAKMHKSEKPRTLYARAELIVDDIILYMKKNDLVEKIEVVGSFRRKKDTVGDLEFAVVTKNPIDVVEYFCKYPRVSEVLVKGDKKASVVLNTDLQVDFRVSEAAAFGSMVQYFTGNKQHNIMLRTYALDRGMSLSEYGIKKGAKLLEFTNEKDFYGELGLPLIPPELRHGWGEIDAAKENRLPKLIETHDIKGDLHMHTTASDGVNTLEEVAEACSFLNYEYIGITDHNPSVKTRSEEEVFATIEKAKKNISEVQKKYPKMKILLGYEVDILADATMGLPDSLLKKLDFAIGSIHTSFTQDREQTTKRLVSALENPYIKILGHPTGRLINEREPINADWDRVFDAAKSNGKVLEINAHPTRLDLTYDLVKRALDKGLMLIINSDAHTLDQLLYLRYGVNVARRGWCEAGNIANSHSFSEFAKIVGVNQI